jgi:pimeloyl-ACP methyl ester carboxylesterase
MSLANILRIALVFQFLAGALLVSWLWPNESIVVALLAGALTPVLLTALVLGVQVTVGAIVDPRVPRSLPTYVLRVWLGETWVSLRAFCWRQPFRANFPEPAITHGPQRPAVLLIHGYVCNRAAWLPLLRSGQLSGCNVATVNLEPVFGPMEAYADEVHAAVERLRYASGAAQVTLVCHSMGGLAARVYLRKYGDAAVARVITLCTPHHGTVFGALGHGANARQMAHRSAFIEALASGESVAARAKFLCVATRDDNLIVPRSSPLLPNAQHVFLEGRGHLATIEDPRAWAIIRQTLHAPAMTATAARATVEH